jgi:hypothetical protein
MKAVGQARFGDLPSILHRGVSAEGSGSSELCRDPKRLAVELLVISNGLSAFRRHIDLLRNVDSAAAAAKRAGGAFSRMSRQSRF